MEKGRENALLKYVGYGKGDNKDYYSDGCCVLAGHYLLTVRHCVKNINKFYFHPEFNPGFNELEINSDNLLPLPDNTSENYTDIAIFDVSPLQSPIKICLDGVKIGEKLLNVSWKEINEIQPTLQVKRENTKTKVENVFSNLTVEEQEPIESQNEFIPFFTEAKVLDHIYKFFIADTSHRLMGGSSGSPVFNKKGEVVGILRGLPPAIKNKSFTENSILFQELSKISELRDLITK